MTLLRTSTLLAGIVLSIVSVAAQTPPSAPAPLYAAVFTTGPQWDPAKAPNEQPFFREHSANLAKLRAAGTIVMGAPALRGGPVRQRGYLRARRSPLFGVLSGDGRNARGA